MPTDGQEPSWPEAVAQITSITGDVRWLILVSGGLLAANLVGVALVVTALLGRHGVWMLGSLGLLVLVILGWLRTSLFVVLAERPVAGALGELRRATGAPVDPSAPWPPLGVRPMPASDLGCDHVVPLIAATNLRHARARLAFSWAVITTTVFCVWMALSFAMAAFA
jgi:hypothetical protein